MSSHWPKTNGPNFVPAYQVSGIPYVTSSACGLNPERVDFPAATRFFVIQNHGKLAGNTGHANLRVGFTENGVNGSVSKNYFMLAASGSTSRLEIRCKTLFLRADDVAVGTKIKFDVLAGLSAVDAGEFPVLTGSTYLTASDGTILNKARPRFKGVG